ncbi:MAG: tetratricopeptide repeat protein, partial [Chitinophagaceae bacterium]
MANFYRTISKQMADPATFNVQEQLYFIDQFKKLGLKREEARAYQFMARSFGNLGNVAEEMRFLLQALNIFEESGNLSGVAATHANLSLLYYDQNDFDEAFSHTNQAISLQKNSGDAFQLNGSYNNLAIIFEKTGPVDSAIFYHLLALDIAKKANMTAGIGLSLSNLGNNYAKKGQYELAEKTLLEALKIRESIGKNKDLAYTHNRLANLYIQINALSKAKHHARLSLDNALKSTEVKVIRMAYERLMEIAAKEGDLPAELTYLKQVTKLKDSILNESNVKETTRRMLTYNFEKKQLLDSAKNAMEKSEAELLFNKRIETERNRKIIFMLAGAVFLLLAFSIYRRNKFQERELNRKKEVES